MVHSDLLSPEVGKLRRLKVDWMKCREVDSSEECPRDYTGMEERDGEEQ